MLQNHKKQIAISYDDNQITYENLIGKIEKFSSIYSIQPKDKVVIYSGNRPGWIYSFYSIWKKKGIAIPIDFHATPSEVAYILKDSAPKAAFVSQENSEAFNEAVKLANIDIEIITIDNYDNFEPNLISQKSISVEDKEETAAIIYTSGTTGSPKGVMLSYKNLIANIRAVSEIIPIYQPSSKVMILLPLHHIFPLLGSMIAPLYVGATTAISRSMTSEDIISTLKNNKITIIIGVPRLYAAIRKGIKDKINSSTIAKALFSFAEKINSKTVSKTLFKTVHKKFGGELKYLVSGGAALDPDTGNDFKTLGFEVLEGFGMTEAAPMLTFTRPGRVKIGSPGEAMPGTTLKIKDGEIIAKGDNIMQGYYNNPQESDEIIKDGWLYTGDLGYIDKEGYLYITGRKKEIIVLSSGKNINPAEIEQQLLKYPEVSDCGVFFNENQIQAVVVPSSQAEDENKTVYETVQNRVIEPFNNSVSSYKKVMKFFITTQELPRTRLGKLQRFKLKEYAIEESTSEADYSDEDLSEEYKIIASYIEVEKDKKVKPHYHLEFDLALDSLDRVGLQVYLNQNFGVEIEAAEITSFGTVKELAQYVAEKKTKMEEEKINWADIIKEKVNFTIPKSWLSTSLIIRISKLFFKIYFRFHSKGVENIPEGPCIIAPNHQSFFDGLFVTGLMRTGDIRKTFFYAKAEHVKQPILKYLARKNNVIVVDLNKNLKESIQKMAEVLKRDKRLIIFPEGTRSESGNLGQFKKTFAILSRELNVPVVPVSITGAVNALPKGSIFPRPRKKIKVEFLKPVYPENLSYESITEEVKDQIESKL
ncbi:AMP-binding protein [Marinilabiliaceae bacterium ANBcel2]|nr:AMP-binding protein [Marinilabiliaceae bacterium ANBcel2]